MINLIIIRHAKSSWEFNLHDFERPLLQKGIDKSYKIAIFVEEFVNKNALIWISSARRTQETAKIFMEVLKIDKKNAEIKNDLYTFSLNQFEQIVKSCPNSHKNLILFGHNNAITDFVNKFGNVYINNVPTSGFVSITFDCNDWNLITKGITDKIIFPSHI